LRRTGSERGSRIIDSTERTAYLEQVAARVPGRRFTLNPVMDELRAAVAGGGFKDLERIATKYAIPVTLLVAALTGSGLGSEVGSPPPPPPSGLATPGYFHACERAGLRERRVTWRR
jgi:hypothetical protein